MITSKRSGFVHHRPEVRPLPPHIRFEQANGFAHALMKGDPAAPEMVRQSIRGEPAEFPTH